jgi:RsiW-degrading membrane proteinase PrsW (M82 family)
MLGGLFVAALVPALIIMWFVVRTGEAPIALADRTDKAPVEIMIIGFTLGVIVTVPVALAGMGLNMFFSKQLASKNLSFVALFFYLAFDAFILTACLEEGAKLLLSHVSVSSWLKKYLYHPYSIIGFTTCAALGFAALENVSYVMGDGSSSTEAFYLAVSRALLAVPLHATTGCLIGIGVAQRAFNTNGRSLWLVMILPIFVHGLYDFLWVIPLRHGAYKKEKKSHDLQNDGNTRDIGMVYDFLIIFNMSLVFAVAFYAWLRVKSVTREYDENGPTEGHDEEWTA